MIKDSISCYVEIATIDFKKKRANISLSSLPFRRNYTFEDIFTVVYNSNNFDELTYAITKILNTNIDVVEVKEESIKYRLDSNIYLMVILKEPIW